MEPSESWPKAIIAPDFDVRTPFSHRERYIPIRMVILPVRAVIAYVGGNITYQYLFNDAGTYDINGFVRRIQGCDKKLYYFDS